MIQKIFSSLVLLLACIAATAQSSPTPNYPAVMPPNPEAGSLLKAGSLSAGLFTGAISKGIPLYTIQNRDLSYPLGISYVSNGFKPDEIPGRLGLGWNLTGMAVVSRTVMGVPDEDGTVPTEPADLTLNTPAVLTYLQQASNINDDYDTQPDQYHFAVAGVSGSFVIRNGQVHQFPYSKIKISAVSGGGSGMDRFEITDMQGNVYTFGGTGAIETAVAYTMAGHYKNKANLRTGWYLKKIVSPEGAEVNFYYSSLDVETDPGFTLEATQPTNITCADPLPGVYYSVGYALTKLTEVEYNALVLNSITTNNGIAVDFTYSSRPDLSGEKRLTEVAAYKHMRMIKKYTFSYADPTPVTTNGFAANTVKAQRFFLTQVQEQDPQDQLPPLTTSFTYNDMNNLPQRLTYRQDYYGFYTGQGTAPVWADGFIPYEEPYISLWSVNPVGYGNRKPDWEYAQKGVLSKVTWPTGGYEEIFYESNGMDPLDTTGTKENGGIRVQKITTTDPVSNTTTGKYFTYSSPVKPTTPPPPLTSYPLAVWCNLGASPDPLSTFLLVERTVAPVGFGNPSNVQYPTVKESDDPGFVHGYVEHQYQTGFINTGSVVTGTAIGGRPMGWQSYYAGEETATRVYNSDLQLIKENTAEYSIDSRGATELNIKMVRKRFELPTEVISLNSYPEYLSYDVNNYQYISKWIHLNRTESKEWDAVNSQWAATVQDYYYDNAAVPQATRIQTTNSRGETVKKEMKYPSDLAATGNIYQTMLDKNIVMPVVEEKTYKAGQQQSFSKSNYALQSSVFIKPVNTVLQKGSYTAETRMRYHQYDAWGNPLEVSKENDTRIAYIWDYNHELPIAEALNAGWKDVAYTSFESNGTGNWSVPGLAPGDGPGGFAGSFGYGLSNGAITNGVYEPAKNFTYIVSYWLKNGIGTVLLNGHAGTALLNKNGWSYFEHVLVNPSTITLSGTGRVDELRMHPVQAQMKSLTYIPGIGTQTAADARGYLVFYEYDGFGRLLRLRDLDKNIIKQYDYKTAQSITPCANTSASWVATGATRCQNSGGNYTGDLEAEQRDMNNCSPGYWSTRWVNTGASTNCPVCTTTNCSGEDKKCINGVCETGIYQLVNTWFSNGKYYCEYRYKFSDNSYSPLYTTPGSFTPCGGIED